MDFSIIEFSVENFRIFKDRATFSMLARKNKHSFSSAGRELLKTSIIYGPNASGKTTLFSALDFIKNGVTQSAFNPTGVKLLFQPFLLSENNQKAVQYDILFALDNVAYKYNFSVFADGVETENLYKLTDNENDEPLLIRKKQDIELFGIMRDSDDVKEKTRKDVLFLSSSSQWNNPLAIRIVQAFNNLNIISGPDSSRYQGFTVGLMKNNSEKKKLILDYLKKADFCIDGAEVEKMALPDEIKTQFFPNIEGIPDEMDTVFFQHSKYDGEGKKIGTQSFNLAAESAGTQKFFSILGPIVDTLENGKILFIDEFDNSLHPVLTKYIVDLFENNNNKNAQLVATTHDTSLLSYKNDLIKDQFWFTEKDKFGAGHIFSLAEFDLRNDTEYSKKYLEGRFGALPYIESFS